MQLHERLGAWLTPEGCFFRVWAPHAAALAVVVQDGPLWEVDDTTVKLDLVAEGGYWSGTVPRVRPGQLYRFEIHHPDGRVSHRLDPAARDVVSSELTRNDPNSRNAAWWKREVQDFFFQNARMFFEDYGADGLRFDVTTQINGEHLRLVVERLRRDFPDKYLIAEHLPDHPWIVNTGGFCATWDADSHHECQRALAGQDALNKVKRILGWDGYDHAWNLVK